LQKVEPASVREFLGLAALEMRRELLDLCRHFYGVHGIGANLQTQSGGSSPSTPVPESPAQADDPDDLERWTAFHEGGRWRSGRWWG
jgi:RNA polymerase sigma-70 factor (ECF subfamily)